MTIDERIKEDKTRYDIKKGAAIISGLSSGKNFHRRRNITFWSKPNDTTNSVYLFSFLSKPLAHNVVRIVQIVTKEAKPPHRLKNQSSQI